MKAILQRQGERLVRIYNSMPQTDELWEKRMRVLNMLSAVYWQIQDLKEN